MIGFIGKGFCVWKPLARLGKDALHAVCRWL